MKILLTILALVLVAPLLLLVGVALGPAILVLAFIAGFALLDVSLVWLADKMRSHRPRRAGTPPAHR